MSMRRLKKFVMPVLLVVLSCTMLVACGSNNANNSSSSSKSSKSSKKSTDKGPLNIIMWVNPPAVKAVKAINKNFEKKYGVKVNLQTAANNQQGYLSLQQTSVSAGTADIMAIQPFQPMPVKQNTNTLSKVQEWAKNGIFMQLNNESFMNNFQTSFLKANELNGKYYALETGVYQTGLFYDKDVFKKYNLKVPTTYKQLVQVCNTLKSHNVTPIWTGFGGGANFYTEFLMYPIMLDMLAPSVNGGNVAKALATGKVKWTDPKMVTALNREKTIANKYLEKNFTGENWQQMPANFANGKAAMLLDGSWDLPSVYKGNANKNIGYFPLPGSNTAADNKSVANADLAWTVLNNSKHKDLAKKWLAFFASHDQYSLYVKDTGISPSEKGTFTSQASKVMGKYFGKGRLISQSPNWIIPNGPTYLQKDNFWNNQEKMLQGNMSVNDLLQKYQQSQNQASK